MHILLRAGLIKFLVLTIVCFLLFTFYFLVLTSWFLVLTSLLVGSYFFASCFLLLCFLLFTFSFTQAATKRRDDDDAVTR